MRKQEDIRQYILLAGLPLDRVYTRVIPYFSRDLSKQELENFERIYKEADSSPDKEEIIMRECEDLKIPLERMDLPVEVYFTRSLTESEAQVFEDIYNGVSDEEKRRRELPSIQDFIEAYAAEKRGDNSLMNSYLGKMETVNRKYAKK